MSRTVLSHLTISEPEELIDHRSLISNLTENMADFENEEVKQKLENLQNFGFNTISTIKKDGNEVQMVNENLTNLFQKLLKAQNKTKAEFNKQSQETSKNQQNQENNQKITQKEQTQTKNKNQNQSNQKNESQNQNLNKEKAEEKIIKEEKKQKEKEKEIIIEKEEKERAEQLQLAKIKEKFKYIVHSSPTATLTESGGLIGGLGREILKLQNLNNCTYIPMLGGCASIQPVLQVAQSLANSQQQNQEQNNNNNFNTSVLLIVSLHPSTARRLVKQKKAKLWEDALQASPYVLFGDACFSCVVESQKIQEIASAYSQEYTLNQLKIQIQNQNQNQSQNQNQDLGQEGQMQMDSLDLDQDQQLNQFNQERLEQKQIYNQENYYQLNSLQIQFHQSSQISYEVIDSKMQYQQDKWVAKTYVGEEGIVMRLNGENQKNMLKEYLNEEVEKVQKQFGVSKYFVHNQVPAIFNRIMQSKGIEAQNAPEIVSQYGNLACATAVYNLTLNENLLQKDGENIGVFSVGEHTGISQSTIILKVNIQKNQQ